MTGFPCAIGRGALDADLPLTLPSQSGTEVPAVGAEGAGKNFFFATGGGKNGFSPHVSILKILPPLPNL